MSRFGYRFNDGCLFEKFFNIYFHENVDCKLKPNCVDITDKQLNWVKINNIIFMKYCSNELSINENEIVALAKGRNEEAILTLMNKVMQYSYVKNSFKEQGKDTRKSIKEKIKSKFGAINFKYDASIEKKKEKTPQA